jgi:death on curing protein
MKLITLEQLLQMHALIIQETGGSAGLRDLGRLEAALATQTQNVFGEELYKSTSQKAAALIRAIIADHPFSDGNKRTGMLTGLTFLKANGTNLSFEDGEIEDFAVTVAVKKLDVIPISAWLDQHTSL